MRLSFGDQLVRLLCVLALSYVTGSPALAAPTSRPTSRPTTTPQARAKAPTSRPTTRAATSHQANARHQALILQFWTAVRDLNALVLRQSTGFPFQWDGGCFFFHEYGPFYDRIRAERPPSKLQFDKPVPFDPNARNSLRLQKHWKRLKNKVAGCGPIGNPILRQIAKWEHRYYVVRFRMAGMPPMPTLTRISKNKGVWRVTGFEN